LDLKEKEGCSYEKISNEINRSYDWIHRKIIFFKLVNILRKNFSNLKILPNSGIVKQLYEKELGLVVQYSKIIGFNWETTITEKEMKIFKKNFQEWNNERLKKQELKKQNIEEEEEEEEEIELEEEEKEDKKKKKLKRKIIKNKKEKEEIESENEEIKEIEEISTSLKENNNNKKRKNQIKNQVIIY
jgi:hypothetical protein